MIDDQSIYNASILSLRNKFLWLAKTHFFDDTIKYNIKYARPECV